MFVQCKLKNFAMYYFVLSIAVCLHYPNDYVKILVTRSLIIRSNSSCSKYIPCIRRPCHVQDDNILPL